MAVAQISRIQVRRGQKNQGSGIPQLAGGEFGWAVDSRELYIGNGSVAEGAPAVGNTKLITQHDDFASEVLESPYGHFQNLCEMLAMRHAVPHRTLLSIEAVQPGFHEVHHD